MTRAVIVSIALLDCALSISCASFPGNQLEAVDLSDIDRRSDHPSVEYALEVRTAGRQDPVARATIQERVDAVFASSKAFDSYRAGVVGLAPMYLGLEFEQNFDPETNQWNWEAGRILGYTLFVVPVYVKDEYRLVAKVYRDGELVKQYEYADHIKTWIQLFLFPLSFTHSPSTVAEGVIDNMFAALIRDMERDGFLSNPVSPLDTAR